MSNKLTTDQFPPGIRTSSRAKGLLIRLVELIWESIAAIPEAVEVTPEIKAELEERLKEFEANPEAGYSWEQVKTHLRNGTWRSV